MLPQKMKAAIFHGLKDIRLKEVNVPTVEPGYVLIDTKVTGICGSDLHSYFGRWGQPKFAAGHEFSGIVAEVGEGVTNVEIGDRVCVECFGHCGECSYCKTGNYNLCDNIEYLPSKSHAGFAEFALVHASSLFRLPEGMTFEEGALVEPLAVSYRAFCQTRAGHKDRVAILGAGTIGLGVLMAAKAAGVRKVIISAKYEHQAQMAKKLGADHVIRVQKQDLREKIKQFTQGLGVDAVIETVATAENFNDALDIVRKKGTISLVGGYSGPLEVNLGPIGSKELRIVGSQCYAYGGIEKDFDAVINMITAGKINAGRLVTHRFPLEEIAEAFRIAADKKSGSIKVQLRQQ